jgi:hypothetical protein
MAEAVCNAAGPGLPIVTTEANRATIDYPKLQAMEPVHNIAQVMQALRRQMAANLERLGQSGKLTGQAGPLAGTPSQRVQPTVRQAMARRIRSIDPDDPGFLEKAALVFVESVLLAEFGEKLLNDPEFRDLATQVQSAMISNSEIREDLQRLTQQIHKG